MHGSHLVDELIPKEGNRNRLYRLLKRFLDELKLS